MVRIAPAANVRTKAMTSGEEFWNRPFPRPEFDPGYGTNGKVIVAEEGGSVIGMAKGVLDRGCVGTSRLSMWIPEPPPRVRYGVATDAVRVVRREGGR